MIEMFKLCITSLKDVKHFLTILGLLKTDSKTFNTQPLKIATFNNQQFIVDNYDRIFFNISQFVLEVNKTCTLMSKDLVDTKDGDDDEHEEDEICDVPSPIDNDSCVIYFFTINIAHLIEIVKALKENMTLTFFDHEFTIFNSDSNITITTPYDVKMFHKVVDKCLNTDIEDPCLVDSKIISTVLKPFLKKIDTMVQSNQCNLLIGQCCLKFKSLNSKFLLDDLVDIKNHLVHLLPTLEKFQKIQTHIEWDKNNNEKIILKGTSNTTHTVYTLAIFNTYSSNII